MAPAPHGGVPVRWYRPTGEAAIGVIVFLHGGGWVVGGLDESDALCRELAVQSGCDVVSVGYRLAPEHPFPAAVEDAETALRWVAAQCERREPLIVMGDSAGGNLATVVARRLRDADGPRLALQILVYPVTDHRMSTPSYRTHAAPLLIGSDDMRWFWDLYVPDEQVRASPDVSVLATPDLSGMPPTLLLVAGHDPLHDEGVAYGRRLRDAGVVVAIERYPTMPHGFLPLTGVVGEADDALRLIARTASSAARTRPASPGPSRDRDA